MPQSQDALTEATEFIQAEFQAEFIDAVKTRASLTRGALRQMLVAAFTAKDFDTPALEADMLLAHGLRVSGIEIVLTAQKNITIEERDLLLELACRRLMHEPMAYIVGARDFWKASFLCRPPVLIPRPDSESLIELALSLDIDPQASLLELGIGTGCLSLSLLQEKPFWRASGLDKEPAALGLSKDNAANLGLKSRFDVRESDWFNAIAPQERFDLILSNPPYIERAVLPNLMPDVRLYESMLALDGGPDGLEAYRLITEGAPHYLKPKAHLLFELGAGQFEAVHAILQKNGFKNIKSRQDLSGHIRAVAGFWPGH